MHLTLREAFQGTFGLRAAQLGVCIACIWTRLMIICPNRALHGLVLDELAFGRGVSLLRALEARKNWYAISI